MYTTKYNDTNKRILNPNGQQQPNTSLGNIKHVQTGTTGTRHSSGVIVPRFSSTNNGNVDNEKSIINLDQDLINICQSDSSNPISSSIDVAMEYDNCTYTASFGKILVQITRYSINVTTITPGATILISDKNIGQTFNTEQSEYSFSI